MQFNFDLDIAGIVAAATAPERMQPMLDKAITEALKDALNEATGYRSPFRKQLTDQLTEALPHGLNIQGVAKFQHLLNASLSAALEGANAEIMKSAMTKVVGSVLPKVPARIKLSELLEAARDGFHKDKQEAFYAHFEMSEYSDGGGWLYLDRDELKREKYSADMRLAFLADGTCYALKLDRIDITPCSMPDPIGYFEGLLLSMYVGRTTVDLDIDADEVKSAAQEQYD